MFLISGFYDEATSDTDKQLELIKKLGRKYLCPRGIGGKNISDYTADEFERHIVPRLDAAGVKLSSLGSPIGKIQLNDDEAYARQLNKLKELIKIANLTGCKYIRCFSFFADAKTANDKTTKKKVTDRWKGFLETTEGGETILLHENEKKIYGDVPERVLELYGALNHPHFKLCYDASNYIQCGIDPWKAYLDTREYTVYYHMKDCIDGVEVPLGMGDGRIADIIEDLNKRGYDGFLTLEPHTAKYALLRKLFRLTPLCLTKYGKVFGKIDKQMNKSAFESVGREEVFVWQHDNLVKIIKESGGLFE
ncbi:MAG: sugar phosphate isomerase/epimerase [Clostridiales bacterium]|jgi:sugar phosphate isomerase/epimerase|nr:sugar phosphate isomerase/epimerase [Clostridiales bacterium]